MGSVQSIPTGNIRFLDNAIPELTAGTYNINVNQQVTEPSHQVSSAYNADQKIIVKGIRFSITDSDIQSKFPAVSPPTDCHAVLPFVVFKNVYLPWSRTLDGAPTGTPWLALMIFKRNEISYIPPNNGQPSPTLSTSRSIVDVVNYKSADGKLIGPAITLDVMENDNRAATMVYTIDVVGTNFQALVPALTELPYLAHVRQINSDANAADAEVTQEYYSTLLGNRLGDADANTDYIAHIVSLEGWQDYLPGGTKQFTTGQSVRLISLYSWSYTSKKAGANFKAMVEATDSDTLKLKFKPTTWGNQANYTAAQKETQKKYANGYVALNYASRTGEASFAWYRGPFTPVVPVVVKNTIPFTPKGDLAVSLNTSDQAIIYDPATGIFDHSYAVAWELGRLTTLANRTAALALWEWKKQGVQKAQVLNKVVADNQRKTKLLRGVNAAQTLQHTLDSTNWNAVEEQLTNSLAGQNKFMNYLGNSLGKYITGAPGAEEMPLLKVLDPSGLPKHAESMPGVIDKDDLQNVMQSGTDPHVLLSNKIDKGAKAAAGKPKK